MLRRSLLAVLVATTFLAACSSSGSTPEAKSPGSTTPTTTSAAPATTSATVPDAFTGSAADFYTAPSPLPAGPPGTLIRIQPVGDTDGIVTVRVMYHSIDAAKRDQPVTGIISYPTAAPPKGGWPVISTAPGTVGLDTHCAISRGGRPAPGYGITGVHVMTDYIGMVTGQTQRYLSGPSEAHSVIDAVRAARNIPASHAGTRWVALGHSQGGHSALFTNQLAASYAPELTLLGTAVGAPAAALDKTFGPNDQVIPRMVELMAVFGIAADHPEMDPTDYVGPKVMAKKSVFTTGCLNEIVNTFVGTPPKELFPHNPITSEPAKSIVQANDPGRVKSASPVLLFSGTADVFVVPARVDYVQARLCKIGQVSQFLMLDGANHGSEISMGADQIHTWMADRFAGKTPPNSCK